MRSLISAPEALARSAGFLADLDVPRLARPTLLPHPRTTGRL
jgi:hypothetical protein